LKSSPSPCNERRSYKKANNDIDQRKKVCFSGRKRFPNGSDGNTKNNGLHEKTNADYKNEFQREVISQHEARV